MQDDPSDRPAGAGSRHVAVIVAHGVGEMDPGYTVNDLVDQLALADKDFVAEPQSSVYRLEETNTPPNSDGSPAVFPAYVRNARLKTGESMRFYELYWADLTRVLPGRTNATLALFRVMLESHHFVDAMLPASGGFLTRLLRRLLLINSFILRGVITSLFVCMFAISMLTMGIENYGENFLMGKWSVQRYGEVSMLLVALVSLYFLWRNAKLKQTEWADVCIGSLMASLLIGVWLVWREMNKTGAEPNFCLYPDTLYPILRNSWLVWSAVLFASYPVAILLGLSVWGRRRSVQPLAAQGVVTLQTVLWVIVIGSIALPALALAKKTTWADCKHWEFTWSFVLTAVALCQFIALGALLYYLRIGFGKARFIPLAWRDKLMPRLLFATILLLFIWIGALIHMGMFFYMAKVEGAFSWSMQPEKQKQALLELSALFARFMPHVQGVTLNLTQDALLPYAGPLAVILGSILAAGAPMVAHIARDLIDHEYTPKLGFVYYLLPRKWREAGSKQPRRERISERLKTLVREVILKDEYQGLVFAAHSQGSVIVFDFLREGSAACKDVLKMKAHMVSYGSPLGHVYEYYYSEYANLDDAIDELGDKLESWTNLYRVDDYIGRRMGHPSRAVDGAKPPPLITNIPLEGGGHMYYSRARRISEEILDRVRGTVPATINPPPRPPLTPAPPPSVMPR